MIMSSLLYNQYNLFSSRTLEENDIMQGGRKFYPSPLEQCDYQFKFWVSKHTTG